jgi:hypothetical protein
LPLIKVLYMKKYYSRETESLPHKNIGKSIDKQQEEDEQFINFDKLDEAVEPAEKI